MFNLPPKFPVPSWLPIPQEVFDQTWIFSSTYLKVTFYTMKNNLTPIQFWIYNNKILSEQEVIRIKFKRINDITGGFYHIDDLHISYRFLDFRKKSSGENGKSVWEIRSGNQTGWSTSQIIEKDGRVISNEHISMAIV